MFTTLTALFTAEVKRAVNRRVSYAAALAFAAVFFLFGFAFILVALKEWIEARFFTLYADSYASLIVAGILLVVGAVVAWMGTIKRNRQPSSLLAPSAAMAMAPLAVRIASRSVTPRLLAIGSVVAAGIWLGRRMRNS